jgi:sugar phosphate isomerase/epimerase
MVALGALGPHVVSVHCKDAIRPEAGDKTRLGTEMPLGKGEVGIERFIAKLKAIGFSGPLNVERECGDREQWLRDMAEAVELLRRLTE